jgi:hypothetical protein
MRILTPTSVLGAGAVILLTAGVSVAVASGGSSKTFSACLNTKTHSISLVTESPAKPRHCAAGTAKVSWNATGARGPAGPATPTAAYVPLLGFAAEAEGCGGKSYWAEPANGCPTDPKSTFDSQLISSANFAPGATVRLEASFIVNSTEDDFPEAQMCARLWNVTTQKVVGKPICATNKDEVNALNTFLAAAPVALPKGNDSYKVEVAMPKDTQPGLDNSQGGFVTQAVAVIASK